MKYEIVADVGPNTFRIHVYSDMLIIAKCIGYRNRLEHTVKLYPERVYVPGRLRFPAVVGEENLSWKK